MDIIIGVGIILLGLFALTPVGARWNVRYTAEHPNSGGGGFRAKTVLGSRIIGLFVIAVGVAWLVSSL